MSLIEVRNWPSKVGEHKRSKNELSLEQRILADNDFKRRMSKTLSSALDKFKNTFIDQDPGISFDAGSVAPKGKKLAPQKDRTLYITVMGLTDERDQFGFIRLACRLARRSKRLLPKDWGVKVYIQNPDVMDYVTHYEGPKIHLQ